MITEQQSKNILESVKKFIPLVNDGEVDVIEEYFEEVCWICEQVKLVHNDERTTLGNPGFICKECENNRNKAE